MKRLLTMCAVAAFVLTLGNTAKADLVSYWPFDEGSGTDAYDSVGTNDGTVVGALWTTGVIGGALEFDGTDDYVDCGNDESLNVTQATWVAWLNFGVKPSVAGHLMNPLAKQEQYWIHASSDNSIQSKISVGGTRYIATTGANFIQTDVWYHVAGTYDGGTLKLYVNGQLKDSVNISGGLNTSAVILAIGTWSSFVDYFQGTIDEVAIWNHALTAEEVMDVYTCGVPREPIEVIIDIKPGSYPNAINLGSHGLIPVAILSTTDEPGPTILSTDGFDATTVDPDTVELAGSGVAMRGKSNKYMAHEEDVNNDGLVDLVVQVATENLDEGCFQDGYAVLTGKTYNCEDIEGSDEIFIVPPEE